jgi:hypothetical protein
VSAKRTVFLHYHNYYRRMDARKLMQRLPTVGMLRCERVRQVHRFENNNNGLQSEPLCSPLSVAFCARRVRVYARCALFRDAENMLGNCIFISLRLLMFNFITRPAFLPTLQGKKCFICIIASSAALLF